MRKTAILIVVCLGFLLVLNIYFVSATTLEITDNLGDLFLNYQATGARATQIMWNITAIPTSATINEAYQELYLVTNASGGGLSDNDITVHRIDNYTWTESTSATLIEGMKKLNSTNETVNATGAIQWARFNVTTQLNASYSEGVNNITLRYEDPDYPCTVVSARFDEYATWGNPIGGDDDEGNVRGEDREDTLSSGNTPRLVVDYTPASPNITTPIIGVNTTKTYAFTTDKLNCTANATDEANSTPTIEFTWYNDTDKLTFGENISCTANTLCGGNWLSKENFTHFENITCSVRAWDGNSWSTVKNSTAFYINNSLPTFTSVELNKTSSVVTGDDLNCSLVGQSDNDAEDTLVLHYEWYKDTVAQNIDNEMLDSGNTSANEEWYCEAWVRDGYDNSSKDVSSTVSIGSSLVAPVIVSTNATTDTTSVNSTATFPTKNNTWLNLSVHITDANSATEGWNASFCKTTGFTDGACDGGSWCVKGGNVSIAELSCKYTLSGETSSSYNYYVYVTDCEGLTSTSKSSEFHVNHPPDTATNLKPTNNTYGGGNLNWTQLNWTSVTDVDSDDFNYTVYGSNDRTDVSDGIQIIYNGTATTFNWSNLLDGYRYYWKILTMDQHNYNNSNPTDIYETVVDYSPPNVTNQSLSSIAIDTGTNIIIYANVTDKNSTISSVSVNVNDSSGTITSHSMTLSEGTNVAGNNQLWNKTLKPALTDTWNIMNYTVTDSIGNTQTYSSVLSFTVSTVTVTTSTGGGAGGGGLGLSVVDEEEEPCEELIVEPLELVFEEKTQFLEVNVFNEFNNSVTPEISIGGGLSDYILVRGTQTIDPQSYITLTVVKIQQPTITQNGRLNIKIEGCGAEIVGIKVKGTIQISKLFDRIKEKGVIKMFTEWFKGDIITSVKLPFSNKTTDIKNYWTLIISAIIVTLIIFVFLPDTLLPRNAFFSKSFLWLLCIPTLTFIINWFFRYLKR